MTRVRSAADGRSWVRLDNASNIFLAALSDVDSKVFRFSAEMDGDVDDDLLQLALDYTYDQYPLYHAVLRRGIFWYYLQDSDLRPQVESEDLPALSPIYQVDRRNLLFRVMRRQRRITLEIFHALSDGTGALWFLTDLLVAYTTLCETGELPLGSDAGAHSQMLVKDSFSDYFFEPTSLLETETDPAVAEPVLWRGVYHPRGTPTPDNRVHVVELTMSTKDVVKLARDEGVTITSYMIAVFFESFRSTDLGKARTMTASVPVNLRQFFPSTSARNFFATIRIEYTYPRDDDEVDFSQVCASVEEQMRAKATQRALEGKVARLVRFERSLALRIVPRPLKDFFLKWINWGNNRGLSVAISNMGLVRYPPPAESHVHRTLFQVAAVRPQFGLISQGGFTTISFTSPFIESDHVREFARFLTARGLKVSVAANRVTETDLAVEPS